MVMMFLTLHPVGVYVSQLVQFAGASGCVADFDASCLLLTQKRLKQGYQYLKLCKTFLLNLTPDTWYMLQQKLGRIFHTCIWQ